MCGIVGIYHRGGEPVAQSHLDAMNDAQLHRGPDGQGSWIEGDVGFAHRRLAILDLSEAGHQPMLSEDGRIVVTYNGEIYNYQELARQLERETGYRFKSHCDTEILPIGYAHWGMDLFRRLEGMFAIGLWDRRDRRLVLCRDGIGIKPLYILRGGSSLHFASEVKAFLALDGIERTLDPVAMASMLANGYAAPDACLLKNVTQLPPGHILSIDAAGETLSRFWSPTRTDEITDMGEAVEAVRETLSRVVSDMMISDVRVGILQSGGIDSSLVSYSARGRDVPLFTAQFANPRFDETAEARLVSSAIGLEHHVVPMATNSDLPTSVRQLAWAYDGQLADSSGLAFFELCKTIKRHVTVALAGEGGDEFFAGYPTYRASRIASAVSPFLPSSAWEMLGRLSLRTVAHTTARIPAGEKLGRLALGIAQAGKNAHPQWRRHLFDHQRAKLYGAALRPLLSEDPMSAYAQTFATAGGGSLVDDCLLADQLYYLPGDMLAKTDRISMAHSLEIRVPFLDRRMMDLAGRIDWRLLTPFRGPDKSVLRQCLQRMGGPREVVGLTKKGFNVPIQALLRGPLRKLCDSLFEDEPERFSPYLDADGLRAYWREHKTMVASHHYMLWMLLIVGLWMRDANVH